LGKSWGKAWTDFYSDWVVGFNKLADMTGLDIKLDLPSFTPEAVTTFKEIPKVITKTSEATTYWNGELDKSNAKVTKLINSVANEDGTKKANEIIATTAKTYKAVSEASIEADLAKKKAQEELTKVIKENGRVATKTAKKVAKATSKQAKEATRLAKKQAKDAKRIVENSAKDYKNAFSNATDSLVNGDFNGLWNSLSNGFSTALDDMKGNFKGFSSFIKGFDLTGSLASIGSNILGNVIGGLLNTEKVAPNLGSTDSGSQSLSNALKNMNNILYKNLTYSKLMSKSLSSIDKSFGGLGNTLGGLDLSASSFKGSASQSFLGFSSSQTELQGASLTLSSNSIDELAKGQAKATAEVVTKALNQLMYLIL